MSEDPYAEGTGRHSAPPLRLQDRYRLVEHISQGNMGIIYRAYDETLDRDVAVKFLLPERVASGQASARFLREARAVARLSHPNIMTLYDVGREGDWHYLVLEYIPGQDLHTMMVERGGPLPVHEALHAIRGALEALAYAHAQGIVHRDIKPENIMVTPDGQVKVTDFGLALARGDVRLTQEGMIVGTALYLAPEVIGGAEADHRADLYAVGAVLYELLAGQPPFSGDDPVVVFSQILNAPVTSLHVFDASIPSEIERAVLKLLAKDPGARYALAEESRRSLCPGRRGAGSIAGAVGGGGYHRTLPPFLDGTGRPHSPGRSPEAKAARTKDPHPAGRRPIPVPRGAAHAPLGTARFRGRGRGRKWRGGGAPGGHLLSGRGIDGPAHAGARRRGRYPAPVCGPARLPGHRADHVRRRRIHL